MQDFIESAVLAYECGCNEGDIRQQLRQRLQASDTPLPQGLDLSGCLQFISLVWITLLISPKTVRRWATVTPVSDETMAQWRGFVALIVNGYFEKRMAWFPIDRLQLEMNAVQGHADAPDLVAERARVIYTTLEKIYPQFPSD